MAGVSTEPRNFVNRSLDWLRAGYPTGVPRTDYVPLLSVLHRSLTDEEVESIAADLAAQCEPDNPITVEDIRELIRERAYQATGAQDVSRVSARLATGGWPLAGRAVVEEEAAADEPPSEGSVLARILTWLREGYPQGVPDTDYVPLLALLRRRLTDAEVKKIAKALRKADVSPAGAGDIGVAITRLTNEMPSREDMVRVRDRLTKKGWPVEFPDPDDT